MEHVAGPQTHLRAVCIGPEADIERRQREDRGCGESGGYWAMGWLSPPTCSAACLQPGAHPSGEGPKSRFWPEINLLNLIKLLDIRNKLPLETGRERCHRGRPKIYARRFRGPDMKLPRGVTGTQAC